MQVRRLATVLAVFTLLLAACGDDDDGDAGGTDSSVDDAPSDDDTADDDAPSDDDLEDSIDDLVEGLEDTQAAQGGGSATLTVGDMTYTFDSVLCAFGEEMIGQEGAEFVLSSIQDGTQLYASVDSFGHSVSLDDIEDFENPSVSLSSDFGAGEFIVIDGKNISGDAGFVDGTTDSFDTTPGSFTATCP